MYLFNSRQTHYASILFLVALPWKLQAGEVVGQRKILGPVVAQERTIHIDLEECMKNFTHGERSCAAGCDVAMAVKPGETLASGGIRKEGTMEEPSGSTLKIYIGGDAFYYQLNVDRCDSHSTDNLDVKYLRPYFEKMIQSIPNQEYKAVVHLIQFQ